MNLFVILGTAIGNSFRSRLRTTLTVIAIFIGAFTLTITNGIGAGVNDYIDTQVSSMGASDVITVTVKPADTTTTTGPARYNPEDQSTQVAAQGPPGTTVTSLTDANLSSIEGVAGIASVEPMISVRPSFIQYNGGDQYVVSVNSLAAITKAPVTAGAALDFSAAEPQLVLPIDYVASLGFASNEAAVGATVTLGINDAVGQSHEVSATVVGIQEATLIASGAGFNSALTDALVEAQTIGRPAGATTPVAVAIARVAEGTSSEEIQRIKTELSDSGFTATTVEDQLGTFKTVIDGIVAVLNAFAIIALIAAGFGIINTLLMSVQERTREIGLMKALGMGGGRIFTLFSAEAVFIGFLGSAIGVIVAIVVGSGISAALSAGPLADLAGLTLLLFTPASIGTVILLVMGIAFLAGTLPAYRAARANPIESLRYE